MTTLEQVLLKLGIDQSQVGPGLSDFGKKVDEATKGAHKSFLHVGSAGRAFHGVLEKISEQSPVMGDALKLALNPIVGTLAIATGVFAYFNKKIEEGNARLNDLGSIGKQKLGDVKEAAVAAAKEVAALSEKFSEQDKKEAQARGERNAQDAFSGGQKDRSAAAGRAQGRLDKYRDAALKKPGANAEAIEKSGR